VTLVAVRQEGPSLIEGYRSVVGDGPIRVLEALAQRLRGHRVVMVNSTATGGGVAEILHRLVRLMNELDVPTTWEVMPGDSRFYAITKVGRRQLTTETKNWERIAAVMARLLQRPGQP